MRISSKFLDTLFFRKSIAFLGLALLAEASSAYIAGVLQDQCGFGPHQVALLVSGIGFALVDALHLQTTRLEN